MTELKLINGHFFRDDKEIPIEIGDKEQIECYKHSLTLINENLDGISIDYDFDISYICYFTCLCGNRINKDGVIYDVSKNWRETMFEIVEDDIECSHEHIICPICKRKYTMIRNTEDKLSVVTDDLIKFDKNYSNISDEILSKR